MERPWSAENLIEFIVDSARRGRADSTPFHHLQFDRVFPDDFYSAMLQAMPASEDYRAMSGKTKMASSRPDGKPTRAKIDLFPEYLRHLSSEKRAIWDVVGQALRSKELGRVFMERSRAKLRFSSPVRLGTFVLRHSTGGLSLSSRTLR